MRNITIDVLPAKKKHVSHKSWYKSRWFITPLAVVVVLMALLSGLAWWKVWPIVQAAGDLQTKTEKLKTAATNQDLAAIKSSIPEIQASVDSLDERIEWWGFTSSWPVVGAYYADSQHMLDGAREGLEGGAVLVDGVEPYADVLGFKTVKVEDKPTEDRVAELTLLMPSLLPSVDKAQEHFTKVKASMDQVDVNRYPGKIGSVNLRGTLDEIKSQVGLLESGINQARPLLTALPDIMGATEPKTYLIIFQNDKELRPTGGFMTSVAYVTFDKGQFTVHDQGDIYSIDKGKSYLSAPTPIYNYLKVPRWYMRDTNFSPDFVASMADFEHYYKRMGDQPMDGVIAVDTQFVEDLMKVTGPINVPGYKKPFSAEPIDVNGTQIPQVVYQLEMIAEQSGLESARKDIIGDLMQLLIKKVLSEPATRWPDYVALLQRQGQEKNVLFYFHDGQAQGVAEDLNVAGRIVDPAQGQDYLHINDANLAGLKSNFYLTQATKDEVTVEADGTVRHKLTITYTNTGKQDGWLNAMARNYVRVYVPLGATLEKSSGGSKKVTTSTELNKTVFDNFVQIAPLKSQTITFEYTLPFKVDKQEYSTLIQKQAGAQNWMYEVVVNGQSQSLVIDGDKTVTSEL